jgi:hypothetical protein
MSVGKTKISNVPMIIPTFLGLPNPSSYTRHSLRVSSATALADEGATLLALKRHGQWMSDTVAVGYIRESKVVRAKTASPLSGHTLTLGQSNVRDQGHHLTNTVFNNCVFNGTIILRGGIEKDQI